ncbi:MAG: hypothetical protein FWG66_15135 [Spirochaetes bacterium]|nr:hypothetical protein [Spirochaetota bacterium]
MDRKKALEKLAQQHGAFIKTSSLAPGASGIASSVATGNAKAIDKAKKTIDKFPPNEAFVKTGARPPMDKGQKAELNRKGNVLFNSGEIEKARRVFLTTGYSDGISRVGDYYMSKNMIMEAFQMYWTAPNRRKLEPLLEQLANILKGMVKDSETGKQ